MQHVCVYALAESNDPIGVPKSNLQKKASDYPRVFGGFIRGAKICESLLLL